MAALFCISNSSWFNFYNAIQTITLFLSCCASCSVFGKYEQESLKWIRHAKNTDVLVSILTGIGCGILWGGINYLLMRGSNPIAPANPLKALIVSLNPAILEEVAYRTVLFAFCLSLADGQLNTGFRKFTGWFIMMVPHILPHILFSLKYGPISVIVNWLIGLVAYIAVFGSAIIAHGVVDLIRFCIFGIPM